MIITLLKFNIRFFTDTVYCIITHYSCDICTAKIHHYLEKYTVSTHT